MVVIALATLAFLVAQIVVRKALDGTPALRDLGAGHIGT